MTDVSITKVADVADSLAEVSLDGGLETEAVTDSVLPNPPTTIEPVPHASHSQEPCHSIDFVPPPMDDPMPANTSHLNSSMPSSSFWLNPQPTETVQNPPESPVKGRSCVGISDEEMPIMGTFDVGGNLNEPRPSSGGMLESSAAVIKDLSSLTALSHVDPEQALLDLLSHCGIDVEIIDQKWHHEILPLFESISPNVSSSSILYPDEDPDSFKEFLR